MGNGFSSKKFIRSDPTEKGEQYESKMGPRQIFSEGLSKHLMARGLAFTNSKELIPLPHNVFEENSEVVKLISDTPNVSALYTITRREKNVKAEFIGIADEILTYGWSVFSANLVWDEIISSMNRIKRLLQDRDLDEWFSMVLLFMELGKQDAEFTLNMAHSEWVYRITHPKTVKLFIRIQLARTGAFDSNADLMKLRSVVTAATAALHNASAATKDEAIKAHNLALSEAEKKSNELVDTEFRAAEVAFKLAEPIVDCKSRETWTESEYKVVETFRNRLIYPFIEVPVTDLEIAMSKIEEAFVTNKAIAEALAASADYDKSPVLLLKVRKEFEQTYGREAYILHNSDGEVEIVTDGNQSFSGDTITISKELMNKLPYLKRLSDTTEIPQKGKEGASYTVTKSSVNLRISTIASFLRRRGEDVDDDFSRIVDSSNAEVIAKVPLWTFIGEVCPIWTDREEWDCRGLGTTPEAVAARLIIMEVFTAEAKIAYFKNRNKWVKMTFATGIETDMLKWYDLVSCMKVFDGKLLVPYFYDSVRKTWDDSNYRKSYCAFRTMKIIFKDWALNDEGRGIGVWTEVISQFPELLNGFYFVDNLYAILPTFQTERHLLSKFKTQGKNIRVFVDKMFARLTKSQPNITIESTSGIKVLDVLSNSGILYAPTWQIIHFGTFFGAWKLFTEGIPFGKPKVKPILLAHFGWDSDEYVKEMGSKKFNAVYAKAVIGETLYAFDDQHKVIHLPDNFGPVSIPVEKRVYMAWTGSSATSSYVLLSDINMSDYLVEDQYLGSVGVLFKPGGH